MNKFICSIIACVLAQMASATTGYSLMPGNFLQYPPIGYYSPIEKFHEKFEYGSKKKPSKNKKKPPCCDNIGPCIPCGASCGPMIQTVQGPKGATGHRGHRGYRGPRGHRGATGETGATGATGANGTPGATGANGQEVLSTFASVFQPSDVTGTFDILANEPIVFSQAPVVVGMLYNNATGVFTVTQAGYYEVTYGTAASIIGLPLSPFTFSLGIRYQPAIGPVIFPVPGSSLTTSIGLTTIGTAQMNSISTQFLVSNAELPATFSIFNNSGLSISLPALGNTDVIAYATVKRIGTP